MLHLAGRLPHRRAHTYQERDAAHYLRDRLREYTPDLEVDGFTCIEHYRLLFASFHAEFALVALVAVWWPGIAALYGAGVFVLYLAEFMGYRVASRLMPQFDSQNVIARFLAPRPKRLVILTAYYDSGIVSPLSRPNVTPLLRAGHYTLMACMVLVIAGCIAGAAPNLPEDAALAALQLRAAGAAVLLLAGIILLYAASDSEDTRGANHNASGAAALLRVAEGLHAQPLDNVTVWIAAVGSHETWMSGMRRLITAHGLDKKTLLLNMEGVGAGRLHYLEREGFLHRHRAAPALLAAAKAEAPGARLRPGAMHGVPTALHPALERGYQGMSIMGLDPETGLPPHWNLESDRLSAIDEEAIAHAADFAHAILTRLDNEAS